VRKVFLFVGFIAFGFAAVAQPYSSRLGRFQVDQIRGCAPFTINITNTNGSQTAFVHLFFVDGSNCSVADSFVCLTANQTMTLNAADVDPGHEVLVGDGVVDADSGSAPAT